MKHLKYLRYVVCHKWFVFVECAKRGLIWRGLVHDLSKFSPSEWGPYVEYFYGDSAPDDRRSNHTRDDRFDFAWLHHLHHNRHHWQWWIRNGDDGTTRVFEMTPTYRREMLCDWIGAGKAQGKPDTAGWYHANKHKMKMHPSTRAWVESELEAE